MIQNSRIARFAVAFFLPVAAVATSFGLGGDAFSQIVNSAAFEQSAGHSILEVAGHSILEVADEEEAASPETHTMQFSSVAPTKIAQNDSAYDAPVAPKPRMTGAKPLAPNVGTFEGDSSGTFTGSNPVSDARTSHDAAKNQAPQLQPSGNVNSLRAQPLQPAARLQPAVQNQAHQQPQRPTNTSANRVSDAQSPKFNDAEGFANYNPVATQAATSTTVTYNQTTAPEVQDDQKEEPKYESAYLHDQRPQRDTSVQELFASSANSQPLAPTVKQAKASSDDQNFQVREKNFVQQTAYLSPAAPAQPQFQNNTSQQNNRQFGQPQTNRRGQRNQSAQLATQGQRTRQRDLPRQNQSQPRTQQTQQSPAADSNVAKETIAKFSFDANQQIAEGLPIRMRDVLQQSAGRASRAQLIPQYWEVYYDWAQSVSAKHHFDWVSSISSAQRNDASSIEVAKSNAQNEITFTAIQLGKSQAKMKALTGNAQPIVPMDSPTVTRVKTNYEAFKNRGMIAPKFEGIDATLKQMYELIASRANTVAMAQKSAEEAQQLYSRNQSTVDHVLTAGRTWRTAESDFIASVVEYNKAYADYALALPYGRGPIETVVNMLIVKPTTSENQNNQIANGRPNLSNESGSNSVSKNTTAGNDYSIPYSGGNASGTTSAAGGHMQHASNSTGPRPDGPSDTGQTSARSLMQDARQQSTARPAAQSSGFNVGGQASGGQASGGQASTSRPEGNGMTERSPAGTSYIKRPSQFPGQQSASGSSPFSSAVGSQGSPAGQSQPNQPAQKSFQQRPNTQLPASDRTAARPNPFAPAGSASGASSPPTTTPKPPTSGSGFNFGG